MSFGDIKESEEIFFPELDSILLNSSNRYLLVVRLSEDSGASFGLEISNLLVEKLPS